MKKILITVASVIVFLALLSPTTALAASPVIINGSFETGDYTGWTLWEGKPDGWDQNGTWGIAYDGETINPGDSTYDFCDKTTVTQRISPGLPITYVTTDGDYLAYQLQRDIQDHRMYQDVELSASATTLSWDMFYTNHASGFSDSQYLAMHIRNLNDNILETLFKTQTNHPQSIPMTPFTYDISAYAGSTVRIDVELVNQLMYFDAGFDNFVIDQDDCTITEGPPGWGRESKEGWNGSVPPGLENKDKTPPGSDKGNKTGWK